MYTCTHIQMCVQMCSKSCSSANREKKRHSHNSGDSLGGHKNKDDHRKRSSQKPREKKINTFIPILPHNSRLDQMVFFFSEKLSPVDRNRIRDRPLVLISMRWHNKPNAYSCLIRNVLHIPKLVLCHFAPCTMFRTRGKTKSPYIRNAESISNKIIVGIERKNKLLSFPILYAIVANCICARFKHRLKNVFVPVKNTFFAFIKSNYAIQSLYSEWKN